MQNKMNEPHFPSPDGTPGGALGQHSEQLDRLISRVLDDEATAVDRGQLDALMRRDGEVRDLFEDYAMLDREIGGALRTAMGRRPAARVIRYSRWQRFGQLAFVAAAACVAVVVWTNPRPKTGVSPSNGRTPIEATNPIGLPSSIDWFASGLPSADVMDAAPPRSSSQPRVRLRDTDRSVLIIPGRRPGEYLLIQADRVTTRGVPVQRDY